MRILFVNSRLDSQSNPGGDTIQIAKTKIGLKELGIDVDEYHPNELSGLSEHKVNSYDIAHVFNIQTPDPCWAVYQILQSRDIPVVLSPIYWDIYEYWGELALGQEARWRNLARLLGKKLVRRVYLNWQRLKTPMLPQWRVQRRLLSQAIRVLPNSSTEAKQLQKSFALPSNFQEKINVVPNAIDTMLYQEIPSPSTSFKNKYGVEQFVLEVGMIYPVKNQLGLIEALFDLPVPLVFIGQVLEAEADYANLCKIRAAERGNTVFIDRVPHNELPGIYALASVHALPSWRETPGLVSLEAGAAGCKVVSTSIGSARDYFDNLAWYCRPDDTQSIRQAVESALSSPTTNNLRERILQQYTWQKAAEATLAAYNNVIQQN